MPDVTIVYWRDVPAQVIVGKGRRANKRQLSEKFERTIDRCAMRSGARDQDAYLLEWRKAEPYPIEGVGAEIVQSVAEELEAHYTQKRLERLVRNDGWNPGKRAQTE